jgi:hypothetical protein
VPITRGAVWKGGGRGILERSFFVFVEVGGVGGEDEDGGGSGGGGGGGVGMVIVGSFYHCWDDWG